MTGCKLRNMGMPGTISKSEVTKYAVSRFMYRGKPFSSVASLWAETFVEYELDLKNGANVRQ